MKHIKEITDRLAAIGAPISEEDQVVTLLGSLPPSYSTLVTALEARVDDVKLNFVQQALVHEEQKRNGHSCGTSSGGQTDSALVGAQRRAKFQRQVECFECGEIGHIRRDCPRKKKRNSLRPEHRAKNAEDECSDSESDRVFATSVGSVDSSQMDK